ncbi:GNAT family N-acetyltransferase [Staphylococcus massiliensis]|uniref:N-acetyltransferase domain-containing protein n=1 Tax=Staphylococcus massiliensis S46 TaxID=1229783 RepID=K9B186_9STAP|nr:GNAT family N-acetyltransferase [Staphylococcus massiliensis]EKU48592.1 hypothetical protein C273_05265 [Staphylococcus massiliensis S46]MCG3401867.1 GNAT family N-acetyltransferase [Staphylococcus massiliensis]MCG3413120.1 GNAT family N-acetyltransferase [Staphylococcus massiliensis]PNZ98467.1 N-acetyltransferase [Staphylococcus massiliensis CCUG 55927]
MTTYIETERLKLRDWYDEDLIHLQKMNANRRVRQYFPSLLSYNRSQIDFNLMRDQVEKNQVGLFAVELKATGEWIGFIGLNYLPKQSMYQFDELPFYEIGWRLVPEVWGNGLATEGAEAVIKYIRKSTEITKIYSIASENNAPSIRVMEKIGMRKYDVFQKEDLSEHHPLRHQVRYFKKVQ